MDEDVLKLGVTGAVTYALKFLESDIDTSDRRWQGSIREMLSVRVAPEMLDLYYDTTK